MSSGCCDAVDARLTMWGGDILSAARVTTIPTITTRKPATQSANQWLPTSWAPSTRVTQ